MPALHGRSVREWGSQWLDRREREGIRSVGDDRSRWRLHVDEFAVWADCPLGAVTRSLARSWLSELCIRQSCAVGVGRKNGPLAAQTLRNVLNLVRRSFADAAHEELIPFNPFDGLKVHRSRCASKRKKWTILRADEQTKALAALPEPERWMVGVAIGTGIRQGEQWNLQLSDVFLKTKTPHITVRYGSTDEDEDEDEAGPTKSGEVRDVPLFGIALRSMVAWLAALPLYCPENPLGLVFPTVRGKPRCCGKTFRAWRLLEAAVGRHVRWHDLRHTCGSSLVGGWWGSAWSLEEVRVLFGHSTISVTERYAHFASETVERAALRMVEEESETAAIPVKRTRARAVRLGSRAVLRAWLASRKGNKMGTERVDVLAEEKGVEPLDPLQDRRFSKPEDSAMGPGSGLVIPPEVLTAEKPKDSPLGPGSALAIPRGVLTIADVQAEFAKERDRLDALRAEVSCLRLESERAAARTVERLSRLEFRLKLGEGDAPAAPPVPLDLSGVGRADLLAVVERQRTEIATLAFRLREATGLLSDLDRATGHVSAWLNKGAKS